MEALNKELSVEIEDRIEIMVKIIMNLFNSKTK